jgi:hypothetical protein
LFFMIRICRSSSWNTGGMSSLVAAVGGRRSCCCARTGPFQYGSIQCGIIFLVTYTDRIFTMMMIIIIMIFVVAVVR